MQELDTMTDLIILGLHGNTNISSVAELLRMGLAKAETDLLFCKALFEDEGKGPRDHLMEMAMLDWKDVDFPDLVGIQSYPRQGPYEESKKGEDTSWKLVQYFQHASVYKDRIDIALAEFVRSGSMKYYFGGHAIIVRISDMVKDGKEDYNELILKHQNTNRSVGNVTLPGAITLDAEVTMFFEPYEQGTRQGPCIQDCEFTRYFEEGICEDRWQKDPCLPLYREDASRPIPVVFARQGSAYLWHCCHQWGWDIGTMK
jgi:hypothetical protein